MPPPRPAQRTPARRSRPPRPRNRHWLRRPPRWPWRRRDCPVRVSKPTPTRASNLARVNSPVRVSNLVRDSPVRDNNPGKARSRARLTSRMPRAARATARTLAPTWPMAANVATRKARVPLSACPPAIARPSASHKTTSTPRNTVPRSSSTSEICQITKRSRINDNDLIRRPKGAERCLVCKNDVARRSKKMIPERPSHIGRLAWQGTRSCVCAFVLKRTP